MAEETIYLCNFRVSVDGDWLCLRELRDVQLELAGDQMITSCDDGMLELGHVDTSLVSNGSCCTELYSPVFKYVAEICLKWIL